MAHHNATDDWGFWIFAFILLIVFVLMLPMGMRVESEPIMRPEDYGTQSVQGRDFGSG